ncbi:hypothetical protein FHS43_005175 [Streptosporangium becharense]|uniref:DUF6286 domain-containing protein n=1 Tax=Streptosporangium becharense TaxID=1816182 RepID=A0A7W9MIF2_9ACTN|nr:DUF6286 domain-containing protein [Streptosporangium becharense]MBB2913866.1 hypothetical protein [Streptosporangium becharense]MBB5821473.1 hypothetical protein [Streptosporangium becharense]
MSTPVPGPADRIFMAEPTMQTPTAPGAELTRPPAPPMPGTTAGNAAADRAAIRAFRPRRVVPSVVTAALMTVIGALVALEVVSALLDRPLRLVPYDRVLARASSTPWDSPWVTAGAGLVTLLGLTLVLLALLPGRPRLIPVRTGDRDLVIGVHRRGFAHTLAHAAEQVQGVGRARVRVRGRTARVEADSLVRDTTGLEEAVRQAVTARIAALCPVDDYRVRVRLRER